LSDSQFGGVIDETFKYEEFKNESFEGKPLALKQETHAKRIGFFWVAPKDEINKVLENWKPPREVTKEIVDRLGLSHFAFDRDEYRNFFYLDLGAANKSISYKPNSTAVIWNTETGFLSSGQNLHGVTFRITGNKFGIGDAGFPERIIVKMEINGKATIGALGFGINNPIEIAADDIIKGGIKRYVQQ
jgi:hypothetical protein